MKAKAISGLYILILTIATIFSLYIPKNEPTAAQETVIIPDEAIRLRILANSDNDKDQEIKQQVRDAVNAEITKWVKDLTSLEEARVLIQSRLPEIQKLAEEVLKEKNSQHNIQVDFGMVDFPTKLYGEYLYPAGEYEAILITIGEGKGANWWCVLFPPLCFLDFSNGTAVSEGFDEAEETKKTIAELEKDLEEQTSELEEERKDISIEKSDAEKENKGEEQDTEEEKTAHDDEKADRKNKDKSNEKEQTKDEPLYVEDEEDEVEVKFFIVEIFQSLFG